MPTSGATTASSCADSGAVGTGTGADAGAFATGTGALRFAAKGAGGGGSAGIGLLLRGGTGAAAAIGLERAAAGIVTGTGALRRVGPSSGGGVGVRSFMKSPENSKFVSPRGGTGVGSGGGGSSGWPERARLSSVRICGLVGSRFCACCSTGTARSKSLRRSSTSPSSANPRRFAAVDLDHAQQLALRFLPLMQRGVGAREHHAALEVVGRGLEADAADLQRVARAAEREVGLAQDR